MAIGSSIQLKTRKQTSKLMYVSDKNVYWSINKFFFFVWNSSGTLNNLKIGTHRPRYAHASVAIDLENIFVYTQQSSGTVCFHRSFKLVKL